MSRTDSAALSIRHPKNSQPLPDPLHARADHARDPSPLALQRKNSFHRHVCVWRLRALVLSGRQVGRWEGPLLLCRPPRWRTEHCAGGVSGGSVCDAPFTLVSWSRPGNKWMIALAHLHLPSSVVWGGVPGGSAGTVHDESSTPHLEACLTPLADTSPAPRVASCPPRVDRWAIRWLSTRMPVHVTTRRCQQPGSGEAGV